MGRLTIKGLLAHKLRFALTALAVTLGVAFVSGTLVLTDTVRQTFDELFADVNEGTDAYVRSKDSIDTDFGDALREPIPAELQAQVEEVDGVEVAAGGLQLYAQYVDKDGKAIGNPGMGAPTLGFNWLDIEELNPFTLIEWQGDESRAPVEPDEVVMDESTAKDHDFRVGDEVPVLTEQSCADANGVAVPCTYRVVGVARFGDAGSPGGATVALFTTEQAQAITSQTGRFDSIAVVGEDGVSQEELRDRIVEALADPAIEVLTGAEITEENQDAIQEGLSFFNTALLIFAGVALFVGCFIIFNTFSIIVAQRTRELALLRAIGASGRQVMSSVLSESLVVGLFASLVGLIAGIGLSVVLKGVLDAFGFDIPGGSLVIEPRTVITAFVVGAVVTVLSAVLPARRAARVPPIAAMRDVALDSTSGLARRAVVGIVVTTLAVAAILVGLFSVDDGTLFVGVGVIGVFLGVTVLGPLVSRPFARVLGWVPARLRGITGELARENAMRNPRRTAATAAALMIGVALVGFITIFAQSAKTSINSAVDEAFLADYVITSGGFGFGGFSPALGEQVAALPEVEAASPLRFNGFEVDGSSKFLFAFDPSVVEEVFDLDVQAGDLTRLGPGQIAVSERAADDNGWQIGDTLAARFPNGAKDLTVSVLFATGQQEGLGDYGVSLTEYERDYAQQLDNQVYVTLKPEVTAEEGRTAIDAVVEAYPSAEVQDRAGYKEQVAAQINQILGLVYVLLFFAVLIALIGIANTLALSIYERTRELGLLRAVGMTRRQLRSSIRWEAVIIAVFGTLLGLIIAVFFGWALVEALKEQGFNRFAVPVGQLLIVVILAGLAGVLAALGPARRAAKLDVLRAISTE